MHHKDFVKYAFCHCNMRELQTSRILQLFYEGFDDFKRTVSEKSGVKFETKKH